MALNWAELPARLLLRVSTVGQADDDRTSIPTQQRVCQARADAEGVTVDKVYSEEGVSGSLYHSRTVLQEALAEMERGEYGTLIIATLSRYSRDRAYQSEIRRRIRQAGGRLISCDLGHINDNNPVDRLMANIHGDFDEYEREVIRRRTMDGRLGAALEGRIPTRSLVAYGCHVVTKSDVIRGAYPAEMLGKLVHVEPQASIVRRMFALIDEADASLYEVAAILNRENVPTAKGIGQWRVSPLLRMVRNPIYKGEFWFNKTECFTDESRLMQGRSARFYRDRSTDQHILIPVPALIEPETWDRVNGKLRQNQSRKGGRQEYRQMLTGLVRCAECEYAGKYENRPKRDGSPNRLYLCNQPHIPGLPKHALANEKTPHHGRFNADIAERLVAEAVQGAFTSPEAIRTAAEVYQATRRGGKDGDADARQKRLQSAMAALSDIERRQEAALRLQIEAAANELPAEIYNAEIQRLTVLWKAAREEVTAARAGMAEGKEHEKPIDVNALLTHTATVAVQLEGALLDPEISPARKNLVLRGLIETVWLHRNPNHKHYSRNEVSPSRVDVVFKSAPTIPGVCMPGIVAPRLVVSVSTDGRIRFTVSDLFAPVAAELQEVPA